MFGEVEIAFLSACIYQEWSYSDGLRHRLLSEVKEEDVGACQFEASFVTPYLARTSKVHLRIRDGYEGARL